MDGRFNDANKGHHWLVAGKREVDTVDNILASIPKYNHGASCEWTWPGRYLRNSALDAQAIPRVYVQDTPSSIQ